MFAHVFVECKSGRLGNIFCFCGILGQLRLGRTHFEIFTLFHRSTILERSLTTFVFQPAKGLRAESARAVTGRRNSYSGRGEDFLTGQPDFFTETAVTSE